MNTIPQKPKPKRFHVPKPKRHTFSFCLSEEMCNRVHSRCLSSGMNISEYVRHLINADTRNAAAAK